MLKTLILLRRDQPIAKEGSLVVSTRDVLYTNAALPPTPPTELPA